MRDYLYVFIVAPVGRDARLLQDALRAASLAAETMPNITQAIQKIEQSPIGALLVTEEVMDASTVAVLSAVLAKQPAWSDLPVLLLTVGGKTTALSRQRERDRTPLGSITLLERPIRMATLVSSVRSALRSRRRQYEVRDTLVERDRAETSLRTSESRLRLALDTARLGAWELNLATNSIQASATCRADLDLPATEAVTYGDFLLRVHPEDRAGVQHRVEQAAATQTDYAAEYRICGQDGSLRWISASGRILGDGPTLAPTHGSQGSTVPQSHIMVGVTLDITERVLSETALRNADKLALVGRLTSSIAHEINNPLESVTNLLYLLGLADLPPTERDYVATAQAELARVSEITAQTLRFNRQQNSHEVAVVTEILDSVLALYQGRLLTSNISVHREYRCRMPLLCYPGELRQVFTNLIGNAFDATRQGGRILVRERAGVHPVSGQPGLRITVADTGMGIAPEIKRRMFEAFHSTKGNNGTGLGLWICKGIVEKHGGTLRYSSSTRSLRSGTVFSLFLPLQG